ncbi:unnamed protein product [Coregonus sp. 'balchen']|nr:unnamed protein product [Coregonus sp. 'balchen']
MSPNVSQGHQRVKEMEGEEHGECLCLAIKHTLEKIYTGVQLGQVPLGSRPGSRQCSVTCGVGVQNREVYCRLKGTGRVREELCGAHNCPATAQPCQATECLHYTWAAGEWQDCNATCGGMRNRKCSASCGVGYQQRIVSCSVMPSAQSMHPYDAQSSAQSRSHCPEPRPPGTRQCLLWDCPQAAYWKVGPWSKCSQMCGAGVMERRLECLTSKGQPSKHCRPAERPESRAACRERECQLFMSCKEVQMSQGVRMDGEYYMKVKSRILQIFCAEMQTDFPKELLNPFECPYNGSRRQDCDCRNDYSAAGYTLFHKVRLDISSLRIMTTDLQFSQTLLGRPVPFATAGDCYSAAKCPQGQFSINLIGTGLKVAEETKWTSQGNYVSVKVHRSEDGARIYGRCGGFCGKCIPQPHNGLLVQVQ